MKSLICERNNKNWARQALINRKPLDAVYLETIRGGFFLQWTNDNDIIPLSFLYQTQRRSYTTRSSSRRCARAGRCRCAALRRDRRHRASPGCWTHKRWTSTAHSTGKLSVIFDQRLTTYFILCCQNYRYSHNHSVIASFIIFFPCLEIIRTTYLGE